MRKGGTSVVRRVVGVASAVAMVGAGISPAFARDHGGWGGHGYPGGWHGYRHYRHHDGLSAGEAIGIVGLIGAVAIIASAASKNRAASHSSDTGYDNRPYDDRRADSRDDRGYDDHVSAEQEDAVDTCVSAARDEAEHRDGGYAEILDVERPRASGVDGWRVEGRLEQRRSYSDRDSKTRRFACEVNRGQVASVQLLSDAV